MGQGHDHTTPYSPYDFRAGNERFIASPSFEPDMMVGARSRTGIVTCCDARCNPEHFFSMDMNEAFVIRNGGGRTAEESVIRTLALVQVLSEVKEVMVVHHTGPSLCSYRSCRKLIMMLVRLRRLGVYRPMGS
jgi:carbonic anhydrase